MINKNNDFPLTFDYCFRIFALLYNPYHLGPKT